MANLRYFQAECCSLVVVLLLALVFQPLLLFVSAQGSNLTSRWKTLSGAAPLVVARGGFSGIFADSSSYSYDLAMVVSVPDVILWCDVQLTKDRVGICAPDLKLENSTDIASYFAKRNNVYLVNGVSTKGFFSLDFTFDELSSVPLTQGVFSRTNKFDGNYFKILTAQDVAGLKPSGLWLNIQHDAFFSQHNLSMRSFVLSMSRTAIINYISSPEVAFLRSITARFKSSRTKLIFRFLEQDQLEPTTNQSYESLLKNLTFIKTFASGILVPKYYIWPVDGEGYLESHTSLVSDAHKEGLEVFASEFYNDIPLSYNYSYDPISEYLSYIDNGDFSVDGVLSDFPITPSEALDCFSHLGKSDKGQENPLVISRYGASGDYPGCTDLAYENAIKDGVNVLDCPVQMAKDGTPFCLSSINLIDSTTVAQTSFSTLTRSIPAISSGMGIFTFDLSWPQIKSLTPAILNRFLKYTLQRNPKHKNEGRLLTLSDFLVLTKNSSSLSGILLSIEHAAYLAEQGLNVIDAVLDALSKAGYENQTPPLEVMIQSSNSSVLTKFKAKTNYKLVYKVDEEIQDASNSTVTEIKKFAHAVVIRKSSVFPTNFLFLTGTTEVVPKFQSFNLPVYVELFSNEFVSQAWDFYSDATVEINSFVMGANIDGVITDFPKVAARYKKNRCLNLGDKTPIYMSPVQPGALVQLITSQYLPPAGAPLPVLNKSDVVEPPLSTVSEDAPPPTTGGSTAVAPITATPSGQADTPLSFPVNLTMLISVLFLF